jgi:glycosyltransferase involved in cell wall biosynthesis
MKIVLLYSFAIHPGIQKLARTLSRNGHDVKLLVWDRDKKYPKKEKVDTYTAHRFHFKAPYSTILVLLYHPVWWLYEFFFFLKHRPDVVHACNLDTLPPAIIYKLLFRKKICYSLLDLYGGVYTGRIPSIFRRITTFFEKVGIAFTDILFLPTKPIYDIVKGIRIKKAVYIYNAPEDYLEVGVGTQLNSETIIFYGGWIAEARAINEMIDALSELEGIKLVMAGKEMDKGLVKYGQDRLEKFEFLGWIPFNEIIRRSFESDILFIFADPKYPNYKYATPNKLFEAMMCSKPIIVSDGTPMSDIVEGEDCGIVVPYGNVEAIKEAVLRLKNDP